MGLDVSVNVSLGEVKSRLEEIGDPEAEVEAKKIFEEGFLRDCDESKLLSVRPGSYAGVHRVRRAYAEMKGWPFNDEGYPVIEGAEAEKSHLINHSDCDGWYLPEKIDLPIMSQQSDFRCVSIGCSYHLMGELLYMLQNRGKWQESAGHAWDALFIASVASVISGQPIQFH